MKIIVILSILVLYNLEKIVPSFSMKENDDNDHDHNTVDVCIPLVDQSRPSTVRTPLFKSISYIPDIVTVKSVNGKLEYEVGDLLLCEKTSDSNIIALVPLANLRDCRIRGANVGFDSIGNNETEIERIIRSEIDDEDDETEPKALSTSKKIPLPYIHHIKSLLDKAAPLDDNSTSSSSKGTGLSGESFVSRQNYVNIMPLSIFLPAISDQYSDTSIMYVTVSAPALIQVYLDSFYNMECSWYIHSVLQQEIDGGSMIDITWGLPYVKRVKKCIVVSDPIVSLYKRPKTSFWRWFRSENSTIVTSSNIHIVNTGKFIVTYNHRCNTFAKPSNVIRTVNIEAFDVPTSESSTS
ncbi:hypothetical protein BMR1_01G00220 [Babesia microti strain RI]|uniref:Uncharacterized protein n=1 Tax=Babesia microti (strain RI) TaxID=1133968 RepID=A0A1N6LWA7_BABMR|nr:hypothetical protein BMR1_01G00220 [Babesia microti strain RI]SIO73146.1 hypothetical protein BMR1_01G00220 [Babesia microti strain RI]|eukprot:XP_021337258.1 hypothetical protein BMR1_01G00220 [Babesia microti strain RI]